ncbi:type II CRISPR-associated endonuclease Cas1 [Roseibacillus ishigakijimensis]|uniref:CRISPR-associated endonuclease Cas1 n=1 Tax=Roseibacillus ishigakijimensis TaxID=454146 RepID=A0A934RRI3_9BACT|nr:type II CRISPR-associated endonuclease Cas1 [Roseibacillus ishigakijimensis]MBK1835630.1 type II CRISPR-associated endonuclease Cas1 [Roseibacillus ishigakijimensis]
MIKHTLEISQRPARLSLRHRQLVIKLPDDEGERTFACEDIGVLILQHPAISLSSALLHALLESGAVVIICNKKHLPAGLLLPTLTHTELVPRMMAQLQADLPARKQAWKAIIRAKITAQAHLLDDPFRKKLLTLAQAVKSGDTENHEAQAARIYWPALFPERYRQGDKRDPKSESRFNSLLNYGYAIIRAATARALVSAGLQPALGVFHHKRDNPFCLADDLMEPLRPLVDCAVKCLLATDSSEEEALRPENRKVLLNLLTYTVTLDSQTGPLMATLPRYINSFYRLLTREETELQWPGFEPEWPDEPF